jgi:hypothetical protein
MTSRTTHRREAAHAHALAFIGQRLRNRQLAARTTAIVAAARERGRLDRNAAHAALGARLTLFFLFLKRRYGASATEGGDFRRRGLTGAVGNTLPFHILLLFSIAFRTLFAFGLGADALGFVGKFLFLLLDTQKLFDLTLPPCGGIER